MSLCMLNQSMAILVGLTDTNLRGLDTDLFHFLLLNVYMQYSLFNMKKLTLFVEKPDAKGHIHFFPALLRF